MACGSTIITDADCTLAFTSVEDAFWCIEDCMWVTLGVSYGVLVTNPLSVLFPGDRVPDAGDRQASGNCG